MVKKPAGMGRVAPPGRPDGSVSYLYFKADHAVIIPLTVTEILDEQIAKKLA